MAAYVFPATKCQAKEAVIRVQLEVDDGANSKEVIYGRRRRLIAGIYREKRKRGGLMGVNGRAVKNEGTLLRRKKH